MSNTQSLLAELARIRREREALAEREAAQTSAQGSPLGLAGDVGQSVLTNAATDALTSSSAPSSMFNAGIGESGYSFAGGTNLTPSSEALANAGGNTFDAVNTSLGSTASGALGAAGLVTGGIGLSKAIDKRDSKMGALSGATAGMGGAQLATALGASWVPGIGWVAAGGALAGMLATKLLGRKSTKEKESDRWKAVGKDAEAKSMGMGGHDYFAGTGGEKSRDEALLTADAIRNNPDNYNNIPNWDKWNKASQDKFLNKMLQERKVREKKGGIYYDDAYAQQVAKEFEKDALTPENVPSQNGGGRRNTNDNRRANTLSLLNNIRKREEAYQPITLPNFIPLQFDKSRRY